jgi:hypothetical protein
MSICKSWVAIYIGKQITKKVWERLIPWVEGMLNAIQVQNPNKFERWHTLKEIFAKKGLSDGKLKLQLDGYT